MSAAGGAAPRAAVYPPDAVLTARQVAEALQVNVRTVGNLDLPTVYIGKRLRRYVWGDVVAALRERAA